uniref:Protein ABHD13 n=1 Tax=Crassostrea virginica TaxID=6565 RepID=A0A8B8AFA1_CRAVI|nr:protein ABHD13-like [Crassostrea virginica]
MTEIQDDEESLIPKETKNVVKMSEKLKIIEFIVRLVLVVLSKFWKLCTSAGLILLLVFWYYGGLLTFILLLIGGFGVFYNAQDLLLYHPGEPPQSRLFVDSPQRYNLRGENHFLVTRDGVKINVVLIKHSNPNAPTVVYFHGNAGNIGHRYPNVEGLHRYVGVNVLLVEYRGYGHSEGSPSESGLYLDSEAALDFLIKRPDINKDKIVVFGRSLGGAVAACLATSEKYSRHIAALVLENTFTSLPDIAKSIFEKLYIINYIPVFLFKNKYPTLERIQKINIPTLFLSGQGDTLIPPHMMSKLSSVSGSSLKKIIRFPGGTHNETWMSDGYYEAWLFFLQEVFSSKRSSARTDVVDL